jgi:hypothetical protein
MNKPNDELTEALRRLKDDDASMTTSPGVEARLRAEFRLIAASHARRSRMLVVQIAATVALVVLPIAGWALFYREPSPEAVAVARPPQEVVTQYFPLFYSSVPAAAVHVVRMEVPRASMVRFGLLPGDALNRTTGTVLADVIVGEDGLARAVRFVQKVSQEP